MEALAWPLAGAALLLILFAAQTIFASKQLAKGEARQSRPLISLMFFGVCGLAVWVVVSRDPGAPIRGESARNDGRNTGLLETPKGTPDPWTREGVGAGEAPDAAAPSGHGQNPAPEDAPLRGPEAPAAGEEAGPPPDMSRAGEEPPREDGAEPPLRRAPPAGTEEPAPPAPDPVAAARVFARDASALLVRSVAGYTPPRLDLGGRPRPMCGEAGDVRGVIFCAAGGSLHADGGTLGALQREGGATALQLALSYGLAEVIGGEASCRAGAIMAALAPDGDWGAALAGIGRAARDGTRIGAAALNRDGFTTGHDGGFAACP